MKFWRLLKQRRDPELQKVVDASVRDANETADTLRSVRTVNHFGESFQMYGFEIRRHMKGRTP